LIFDFLELNLSWFASKQRIPNTVKLLNWEAKSEWGHSCILILILFSWKWNQTFFVTDNWLAINIRGFLFFPPVNKKKIYWRQLSDEWVMSWQSSEWSFTRWPRIMYSSDANNNMKCKLVLQTKHMWMNFACRLSVMQVISWNLLC